MSLLEDEPETARILAGAASGAVLGWHAFTVVTKKKRFWKKAGLSLMAAGSISNMFDRLVRGHVVDYVGFRLEDKHLEGITYNFADFFIDDLEKNINAARSLGMDGIVFNGNIDDVKKAIGF